MRKNILFNSGSNILVLFVKLAITFVMAPVLVRNLGNFDYGLWEILGGVLGYMGMLDLGVKSAISKYTATYNAEKNVEKLKQTYFSAFIMLGLIAVFLSAFFVVWSLNFASSIGEGSANERYVLVGLILAVQFLFQFPGYVAEGTLEGLQKYHFKNAITLVNSIIGSVILFNFITPENGIVLVALVNAVGLSLKFVVYFFLVYYVTKKTLSPFRVYFSGGSCKELLVFGSKSLVQGITNRVETATDSIVIGFVLGPAAVPFYSIPANLVGYIRTIVWSATHVMMPVFSDLLAKKEYNKVNELYLNGSRIVIALVLVLAIGIIAFGSEFISIWMGPEYGKNSNLLILILVLFSAMPLLNPFANRLLMASNEHSIIVKWAPISALVNIALSIPLCYSMGIIGVAIGSLIPVGLLLFVYRCRMQLQTELLLVILVQVMRCFGFYFLQALNLEL